MTPCVGHVMRGQGGGVIANLISANQDSAKNEAAFGASMKGPEAMIYQAARALSQYGIRVYAIENAGATIVERVFALLDAAEARSENP